MLKITLVYEMLSISNKMIRRIAKTLAFSDNLIIYSVFDKSVSGKTLALEPVDKKIQREPIKRLFAQNEFHRKSQLTFDLCIKTTYFAMSAAYAPRFEAVSLCTPPKGPKMSREAAAKYM
jgi:hypothetical protein